MKDMKYQIDDIVIYIGADDSDRRDAKIFLKHGLVIGINEDQTYKIRLVYNDEYTHILKSVPENALKLFLR